METAEWLGNRLVEDTATQRAVLIIDDAHALSNDGLTALFGLLRGSQGSHLHVLVSGEESLLDRLDTLDAAGTVVYDIALQPFSQDETRAFVNYLLAAGGAAHSEALDEDAVLTLWQQTGGYPGAIHNDLDTLLMEHDLGLTEGREARGLPLVHMSLVVALLAVLIMALFYMGDDEQTLADTTVNTAPPVATLNANAVKEAPSPTATDTPAVNPSVDQPQSEPSQPERAQSKQAANTSQQENTASTPVTVVEKSVVEKTAIQELYKQLYKQQRQLSLRSHNPCDRAGSFAASCTQPTPAKPVISSCRFMPVVSQQELKQTLAQEAAALADTVASTPTTSTQHLTPHLARCHQG